ncbi:hypothetical protein DOTSEDRAFT_38855 [Dothistroma septosporum NZE10]|uniref:Uncharacterized protein n=1 Tax=Dothistroma septosporum (strain NZE10 / CBS 128990) TaxID=675120 RepID=M2YLH8_DOTSN|nr:hypothetical protein DOTSEDRAFT_38855 [Dothistroma septosporum NZE10]
MPIATEVDKNVQVQASVNPVDEEEQGPQTDRPLPRDLSPVLLTAFKTSTGARQWVGYQIIPGLVVEFRFQQTMLAAQTCLPKEDVPIGTAIIVFFQTMGGALFVVV